MGWGEGVIDGICAVGFGWLGTLSLLDEEKGGHGLLCQGSKGVVSKVEQGKIKQVEEQSTLLGKLGLWNSSRNKTLC